MIAAHTTSMWNKLVVSMKCCLTTGLHNYISKWHTINYTIWPRLDSNTTCDAWNKPKHVKFIHTDNIKNFNIAMSLPCSCKARSSSSSSLLQRNHCWNPSTPHGMSSKKQWQSHGNSQYYFWSFRKQLSVNPGKDWNKGRPSNWKS